MTGRRAGAKECEVVYRVRGKSMTSTQNLHDCTWGRTVVARGAANDIFCPTTLRYAKKPEILMAALLCVVVVNPGRLHGTLLHLKEMTPGTKAPLFPLAKVSAMLVVIGSSRTGQILGRGTGCNVPTNRRTRGAHTRVKGVLGLIDFRTHSCSLFLAISISLSVRNRDCCWWCDHRGRHSHQSDCHLQGLRQDLHACPMQMSKTICNVAHGVIMRTPNHRSVCTTHRSLTP